MQGKTHETIVSQQFGPQAEAYLASPVHAQGEDLAQLARIVGGRQHSVALDLGCGGGHVSFLIAPQVQKAFAYDLSEPMVEIVRAEALRRGLNNLEAVQGSVERLPWPDQSFDLVTTRYSAHHWHDVDAALLEARRVLRPGGLMVVMDVVAPEHPLLDSWLQCLELLRDTSHVRDYSVEEWQAKLESAGFRPSTASRFRLRLEFLSWVERIGAPAVHREAIRSLQSRAGAQVSGHFALEPDGSFTIDTMLMTAEV
jgi:ubiquinone/menaquinone biosynthesis C-methylase UbiE